MAMLGWITTSEDIEKRELLEQERKLQMELLRSRANVHGGPILSCNNDRNNISECNSVHLRNNFYNPAQILTVLNQTKHYLMEQNKL